MAAWMLPAALLGSALLGASSSKSAARTQAGAADRAGELQQQQFERQVELQAPFREAGVRALPELEAASKYTPFGMQQFQQDPGYGFRLAEGQKALEAQAAMRGGLISGNALRAASRYGQEMGSQEYTNAFNRYQTERQARLNPLQSLAGMAQTSVGQLGQAGQAMATGVGEAGMQAANARASGYMGGASALSQGLSQYMGYSQGQDRNALLSRAIGQRQGALGFGSSNLYGNEDLGQYL
jgi:Skp family chaperone for outer membrane proteins